MYEDGRSRHVQDGTQLTGNKGKPLGDHKQPGVIRQGRVWQDRVSVLKHTNL